MRPPDGLVRFSRGLAGAPPRPGSGVPFRWLAASGFATIPALALILAAALALPGAPPFMPPLAAAVLLSTVSLSCDRWAVLAEGGGRPLLSAWLSVASLGAGLACALAYGVLAHLLLGWIAAAAWAAAVAAFVAAAARRGGSGDEGRRAPCPPERRGR